MTSNINYAAINERFPVAGQDNDTQTFRDNFDTIKTSLRNAQEEITDLQNNTAKLNEFNDFGLNVLYNGVLQYVRDQVDDLGELDTLTVIDFQNGAHQVLRLNQNITVETLNFPGDPALTTEPTPIGLGKVTLELYVTGTEPFTLTFSASGGTIFKKRNWPVAGDTISITSSENPIIVEIWRRSQDVIFLNYIGQYT